MPEKSTIEIIQLLDGPIERTSQKNGKNYWIAKVKDGKTGRVATALGPWVKSWKIGDTVEAVWKRSEYNGQEQWNLENPNQQGGGFRGGGGAATSPHVSSFLIAATLLAPKFKGTAKDVESLAKLAAAIKPLLAETPATPAKDESAKPAQVKKEEPKNTDTDEEEADDEETLF